MWKWLSRVWLFATPWTIQARILEWVAFPISRGSSQPRDQTQVSHIAAGFFTSWATREAHGCSIRSDQIRPVAQSCPTLCNPMNPSKQASRYLPTGAENYSHTKTWRWIFIGALFKTAKTRKQQRCPSVGEQGNKLGSIQTMDSYSAWKRNELSSHRKARMSLKCIFLSARSQSEEVTYCVIPTVWHSSKVKTKKMISRLVSARSLGRERGE